MPENGIKFNREKFFLALLQEEELCENFVLTIITKVYHCAKPNNAEHKMT